MKGSDRDSAAHHPDAGSDSPGERERDGSVDRPPAEGDHRRPRAGLMGSTRIARRSVVLSCLLAGGLALWSSAPALARIHRGHTFSFAIEPTGAEKLAKPKGVAVNESTGDVYVVDAGHNRIERFSETGVFIAAWGWGVQDGKAEYQVCTTACENKGIAGTGAAQFNTPEAIAIDNSAGPSKEDVYVVSETSFPNVVEKFSATGTQLGRLAIPKTSGKLGGVAVDPSGALWVYDSEGEEIESYDGAVSNKFLSGINVASSAGVSCEGPGFAVDAAGAVFYTGHLRENFEEECPEKLPSESNPVVISKLHLAGEPPVAEPLIQELDTQNSSAVAVDLSTGQQASGDVYVDNLTNVAAFTEGGALIERFGSEAEPSNAKEEKADLTKGSGVAVDHQRGEVLVADASTKNRVDVFGPAPAGPPMVDSVSSQNLDPTSTRLEAQIDANGIDTHYYFQYGTDPVCGQSPSSSCTAVPVPPKSIGSGFGDVHVEDTATGLQSGKTYFFRVIAENEKGETAGSAQTANTFTTLPNPVGLLPNGRKWELVSPPEKGGFGIEAIGGSGGPQGGIMESSEDGNAVTYVADGPIEPEPEGVRSPEGTQVISNRGPGAWSSKDIVTRNLHGEGWPAGKPQEYQLFSADLRYALVEPWGLTNMQEPPLAGSAPEERGIYRRSNATCPATCFQPIVTAENNTGEAKAKFGGQVGIVEGGGLLNGTSDLKHVVFQSEVALTGPKPPKSQAVHRLYEWSEASAPSEQLKLVSVLPGGEPAPNPQLGNQVVQGTVARNAISADGARVFWTQTEEGNEENFTSLYVRDMTKGETLKLNLPAPELKPLSKVQKELEEVHYQIASSDGTKVFFTDTASLTAQSRLTTAREGPADLYVCDLVETGEGKLQCNLTDLTVDPRSEFGETADVAGAVLGLGETESDSGLSIYFVANGVLSEDARSHGAAPGGCARPTSGTRSPEAECNLYLEHYNGETKTWEEARFIATLSQEDFPDWGGSGGASLAGLTSRVSPNGRYVAFMSERSLTGYDNVDANTAAKGARDEEVFLYDSNTQRLMCASCNPTGARPHGVLDTVNAGEGLGLLVDRPEVWRKDAEAPKWLAGSIPGWTPIEPNTAPYQSRYLSDSGRLFFNAADALVPQDENKRTENIEGSSVQVGVEDVYQFEPEGVGDCKESSGCVGLISSGIAENESAFLDASASGNDVFFVTAHQLVASDRDNSFDVYDARVCTDASPCVTVPPPPPPPCGSEASCRPAPPPQAGFEVPASATFVGPGNVAKQETLGTTKTGTSKPLTKAQKLAKALTSCKKKFKHAKKKRVACEKQARKKYGAKKATKHNTGKKK